MGNWFENNPMKSIIAYSITLAGAVFAITYFLLDTNKENLHRTNISNLENQNKILNQTIELIRFDNQSLKQDNERLKKWLEKTPNTALNLDKKIKQLETLLHKKAQTPVESLDKRYFNQSDVLDKEEAFFDKKVGVTFGITEITTNNTASGVISFPNKANKVFTDKPIGYKWLFKYEQTEYEIILSNLYYVNNKYRLLVREK